MTKTVLETALEAEMTEHLGYEKHTVSESENARNGTRPKTVLTEIGAVAFTAGAIAQLTLPKERYRALSVSQHWVDDFSQAHI